MKPIHLLNLLLIAGFMVACSASKSFTKKGNKLAEAGIHDEAAFAFMQALANDRTYIDARVGLRNSGQKALNQYLDKFYKAHGSDDLRTSVYAFRQAEKFLNNVNAYNIELDFPTYYRSYYDEDLAKYLEKLYNQGQTLLEEKKFRDAETRFQEITQLDPSYKDVGSLKKMSIIIPTYDDALKNYEGGNFRKAYIGFEKVHGLEPNYKDVQELRRTSKERATITIAVLPFENTASYAYPIAVGSYIISELTSSRNEFLVVIDRENTERIYKEQKLSLANSDNENFAVTAGELMGAKAILTGKVLDFGVVSPSMRHIERTGYESYQEKVYNPTNKKMELQTRYRKVMYSEFQGSSSLRMKIQYQLISTETGSVMVSDVVEFNERDEVRYISYDGNAKNLFAGQWRSRNEAHPSDKIFTSFSQKREVEQLLSAKRDFKPISEMLVTVQNRISSKVANQIVSFELARMQ